MMLASVRTVSEVFWLALMMPLDWLTRIMLAAPPITPAPAIVLSTLVKWKAPLLPIIWLLALFDITTSPPPCSVVSPTSRRMVLLDPLLDAASLNVPVLLITPTSDSRVLSLSCIKPALLSAPAVMPSSVLARSIV